MLLWHWAHSSNTYIDGHMVDTHEQTLGRFGFPRTLTPVLRNHNDEEPLLTPDLVCLCRTAILHDQLFRGIAGYGKFMFLSVKLMRLGKVIQIL